MTSQVERKTPAHSRAHRGALGISGLNISKCKWEETVAEIISDFEICMPSKCILSFAPSFVHSFISVFNVKQSDFISLIK